MGGNLRTLGGSSTHNIDSNYSGSVGGTIFGPIQGPLGTSVYIKLYNEENGLKLFDKEIVNIVILHVLHVSCTMYMISPNKLLMQFSLGPLIHNRMIAVNYLCLS